MSRWSAQEALGTLWDWEMRHIAQNAAMAIPAVRHLATRWHTMGMGRSQDKILPVLATLLALLQSAGRELRDAVVLELGPGQTPDLLFAALLFGARKTIGLDVTRYLQDDLLHLDQYEATRRWVREALRQGALPASEGFQPERYAGRPSIPDGELTYHLYDGVRCPVEDGTVDVIWSKSVLEHVKAPVKLVEEMARILRPGGLMCHIIDLRDHTTFENGRDWLRGIRYSPFLWNLMLSHRTTWTNRLRAPQWEGVFAHAGLRLIRRETVRQPLHADFSRAKLPPQFASFTDEELQIAWLHVAYQK